MMVSVYGEKSTALFFQHAGTIYLLLTSPLFLANSEFILLDTSELLVWLVVKVLSVFTRVVSSAYIIGKHFYLLLLNH